MSSKKFLWTAEQQEILFSLQAIHGNKWALIATKIADKDDNSIKNKFYSTLRKGLRKINSYIMEVKKKTDPVKFRAIKTIQDIFIAKLIAVVDSNYDEKYQVKPRAIQISTSIQQNFIKIARNSEDYLKPSDLKYNEQELLLESILEFNKNCKKRKGKKKHVGIKQKRQYNERLLEVEQKIWQQHQTIKQNQQIKQNLQFGDLMSRDSKESSLQTLSKMQEDKSVILGDNKFQEFGGFFFKNYQRNDCSINVFSGLGQIMLNQPRQELNDDNNMLQSLNLGQIVVSQSYSWMYESATLKNDLSKKMSNYLTQPSLYSVDPCSPFTLNNIIKNNNITTSNMFDDKSSYNDFIGDKGSNCHKDDNLSFVDRLPKFGEFLVQSADLKREIHFQEKDPLSTSMKIQRDQQFTFNELIPMISQNKFIHQASSNFSNEYAFCFANSKFETEFASKMAEFNRSIDN